MSSAHLDSSSGVINDLNYGLITSSRHCRTIPDAASTFSATMFQTLRTLLLPTARCWDANSERSYQDLFERLDTNKDGKVDVAELRAGLKAMGIFRQGAAQVEPLRGGLVLHRQESQGLACLICMKFLSSVPAGCVSVCVRELGE